jgi:hypothetical protein
MRYDPSDAEPVDARERVEMSVPRRGADRRRSPGAIEVWRRSTIRIPRMPRSAVPRSEEPAQRSHAWWGTRSASFVARMTRTERYREEVEAVMAVLRDPSFGPIRPPNHARTGRHRLRSELGSRYRRRGFASCSMQLRNCRICSHRRAAIEGIPGPECWAPNRRTRLPHERQLARLCRTVTGDPLRRASERLNIVGDIRK